MGDNFILGLVLKGENVAEAKWQSENVLEITRENLPPFQAAIIKEKLVTIDHVQPFMGLPVSVIVNFPKVGRWSGDAIALCEEHGKAWGQWSVLLRSLRKEFPETTENNEISFNRRALSQHSRVSNVSFQLDHVLLVEHEIGKTLRVALLYQYDLCGDDVRSAWDDLGPFDLLLKTNPNGSILDDVSEVADALSIKVFGIKDTLAYLAKGKF